ncbi:MAG: hypothetical protein ACRDHY_17795, partial [Anaerolineales bacterium]
PHLVPAQRHAAEPSRGVGPAFHQFTYLTGLALTLAALIWGRRLLPAAWRRRFEKAASEEPEGGDL